MLPYQQQHVNTYTKCIADSFLQLTNRILPYSETAETLYHAPFVLVSHGTQADPMFCYANLSAQKLWQISWEKFVTMPSRLSAEPEAREARNALLKQAEETGLVQNYSGIRITSEGKRFRIVNCLLWNVSGEAGQNMGQAAMFERWEWL